MIKFTAIIYIIIFFTITLGSIFQFEAQPNKYIRMLQEKEGLIKDGKIVIPDRGY